jgi:hypothetical protein
MTYFRRNSHDCNAEFELFWLKMVIDELLEVPFSPSSIKKPALRPAFYALSYAYLLCCCFGNRLGYQAEIGE